MTTEELFNRVELTAKLYKCHDSATKLFKEKWPEKFENWAVVIHAVMKRDSCQEIEAAITIGKELDGFSLMVMLATVAELIEPKLRKSLTH